MFPDSHPGDTQMLAEGLTGDEIAIFFKSF